MRVPSRLPVPTILLLASAAFAVYMPVYVPTYTGPSEPVYALETSESPTSTLAKGADTSVRATDTIGLYVDVPTLATDVDYRADAKGWRDSLPVGVRKALEKVRLPGTVVFAHATEAVDTLPLEVHGWAGGARSAGRMDTAGALRRIVLKRPENVPGTRIVLVLSGMVRSRKIVPSITPTALDLLEGWGMWDERSSKWVAWGMVPFRKSKSDWGAHDAATVADAVVRGVLDEAPIPSGLGSVRSTEKKAKYGGLLLGASFRPGFHTGGDLYSKARENDSKNSVNQLVLAAEAGWYSDWWGVGMSFPFIDVTNIENTQSDGMGNSSTKSANLFHTIAPSLELTAFLPVSDAAVTAGVGLGYMSIAGDSEGWTGPAPSGSGWFWSPRIGVYFPFKYAYFGTDLGLEFQSYTLGDTPYKSSSLFFFDLRLGLRLIHD